ncbi:unnamed protein product [Calicophoron daubneyi]
MADSAVEGNVPNELMNGGAEEIRPSETRNEQAEKTDLSVVRGEEIDEKPIATIIPVDTGKEDGSALKDDGADVDGHVKARDDKPVEDQVVSGVANHFPEKVISVEKENEHKDTEHSVNAIDNLVEKPDVSVKNDRTEGSQRLDVKDNRVESDGQPIMADSAVEGNVPNELMNGGAEEIRPSETRNEQAAKTDLSVVRGEETDSGRAGNVFDAVLKVDVLGMDVMVETNDIEYEDVHVSEAISDGADDNGQSVGFGILSDIEAPASSVAPEGLCKTGSDVLNEVPSNGLPGTCVQNISASDCQRSSGEIVSAKATSSSAVGKQPCVSASSAVANNQSLCPPELVVMHPGPSGSASVSGPSSHQERLDVAVDRKSTAFNISDPRSPIDPSVGEAAVMDLAPIHMNLPTEGCDANFVVNDHVDDHHPPDITKIHATEVPPGASLHFPDRSDRSSVLKHSPAEEIGSFELDNKIVSHTEGADQKMNSKDYCVEVSKIPTRVNGEEFSRPSESLCCQARPEVDNGQAVVVREGCDNATCDKNDMDGHPSVPMVSDAESDNEHSHHQKMMENDTVANRGAASMERSSPEERHSVVLNDSVEVPKNSAVLPCHSEKSDRPTIPAGNTEEQPSKPSVCCGNVGEMQPVVDPNFNTPEIRCSTALDVRSDETAVVLDENHPADTVNDHSEDNPYPGVTDEQAKLDRPSVMACDHTQEGRCTDVHTETNLLNDAPTSCPEDNHIPALNSHVEDIRRSELLGVTADGNSRPAVMKDDKRLTIHKPRLNFPHQNNGIPWSDTIAGLKPALSDDCECAMLLSNPTFSLKTMTKLTSKVLALKPPSWSVLALEGPRMLLRCLRPLWSDETHSRRQSYSIVKNENIADRRSQSLKNISSTLVTNAVNPLSGVEFPISAEKQMDLGGTGDRILLLRDLRMAVERLYESMKKPCAQ